MWLLIFQAYWITCQINACRLILTTVWHTSRWCSCSKSSLNHYRSTTTRNEATQHLVYIELFYYYLNMASTIIQNCQRGTVFICFLAALFFFIMNTISLIKKRLDPINEEGDAGKYKPEADVAEGKNKPRPSSESINNLDMVVTRNTEVEDSDEGIIKVIKRFHDLELNYFSILIVFPLNIVTGTSKVFQMVDFFIIIICIVLFNIAKIHQSIT